jgi:hypothetical protein
MTGTGCGVIASAFHGVQRAIRAGDLDTAAPMRERLLRWKPCEALGLIPALHEAVQRLVSRKAGRSPVFAKCDDPVALGKFARGKAPHLEQIAELGPG